MRVTDLNAGAHLRLGLQSAERLYSRTAATLSNQTTSCPEPRHADSMSISSRLHDHLIAIGNNWRAATLVLSVYKCLSSPKHRIFGSKSAFHSRWCVRNAMLDSRQVNGSCSSRCTSERHTRLRAL